MPDANPTDTTAQAASPNSTTDQPTLAVTLKPCPFCGGVGDIESQPSYSQAANSYNRYRGWCDHCGYGLDWHSYEPDAITAWNTRTNSEPRPAGEPWPGYTADQDKRRVVTLAKLGLMLSVMAGGEAGEVVGYDAADLYAEVLMALAIEDADDPDIALEVARDDPEAHTLAQFLTRPAGDLREAVVRIERFVSLMMPQVPMTTRRNCEAEIVRMANDFADLRAALATHSPAPITGEVERLREALKWALPLAERAMDDHRLERIRCGHTDISGTYKNGVTWSGIWQAEVDQIEVARAAAHPSTQEGADRG